MPVFLLLALARRDEVGMARCAECGGLRLRDLLARHKQTCGNCPIRGRRNPRIEAVGTRRWSFVDGPTTVSPAPKPAKRPTRAQCDFGVCARWHPLALGTSFRSPIHVAGK